MGKGIIEQHIYHEVVRRGVPRLGRHLKRDPRSLAFKVEPTVVIKPIEWPSPLPILDQGNVGSCVGNSGAEHLAERVKAAGLPTPSLDGMPLNPDISAADEAFALALYHEATSIDGDAYPPTDNGTSGLSACQALKNAHLILDYSWATSLLEVATMLQVGSAMLGMPWYQGFFNPDAHGFIDGGTWGGLVGGHEILIEALEAWDASDPRNVVFRCRNHWRSTWGDGGRFRMLGSTYEQLKDQVDVKQVRVV